MSRFKKYCVTGKFKLANINPADTPFLKGTEEMQREELEALAVRLDDLQNKLHAEGQRKLLLVLQGLDTSGKDGTIRWVFSRTSPLGVRVKAFKVPSQDERAHDFLWRCHAAVPPSGEIAIWNRSHYEDVLVPVVEGLIDKGETRRRYAQINDFERLLSETGTVIIKCMLHITKEEQRKRLQARIDHPDKRWKFQMDDLSVRTKWAAYEQAYEKALEATSTACARWHVVPADSKIHRNLMVAHLIVKTLEDMKLTLPPASPALDQLVVQ